MDFTRILPEECQSLIISFTSPADAGRLATVCPSLRSAVDSDAVWENFLPHNYRSIVSGSWSLSLLSLGPKDLYFLLCSRAILVDNGTMSFQLEKGTGRKCYMLGARALSIVWGDTSSKWTWTSLPESRFPEVAELLVVWWLHVTGRIETGMLSPDTNYGAYLVFKLRDQDTIGFRQRHVGLNVNPEGVASREERKVSLDPEDEPRHVRERGDGWMEVEMGEFFNERGDNGSVEFMLKQIDTSYPKQGLIIEGIEIRPKDIGS
ncbi:hypothetical protein GQ457_12G001810 [Hibiscus cannabinus]